MLFLRLRYSGRGRFASTVAITGHRDHRWLTVTVDDDGPGIAADDLPHVFERLWTGNRGTARQVGSGLGLAISAELIAAMGGEIQAESPIPDRHPAGGTRLVVKLKTT